ncbi:MAG: DegV family EDD domain-containing protein [Oscillospiraceae bacterium]|nr:DegV family EDD domain-containing protein [Oscillospiraceae bacterium]
MTKQVIITSDSAADIPRQMRGEIGLRTLPLHIISEGRSGRDCVDISPGEIFQAFCARKSIPKTAAPSPEEYRAFFEGFTRQGASVVHISLSHKHSSCCQNAMLAAREAEGEVHVADSLNFCISLGMLCIQAHRLRGEGLAAGEIAAELTRLRGKVWGWYYLDALDFIAKSGRFPAVLALGAGLLSLHPAIYADGSTGGFVIGRKYRGKSAQTTEAWLRDTARRFLEECDPALCIYAHTPDIPTALSEPLYGLARELLLPHVGRLEFGGAGCVGCATISHVGGGCFGIVGMAR